MVALDTTRRHHIRNDNPPWGDGETKIPPLSPPSTRRSRDAWSFKNTNVLLGALDHVGTYWELDCCGRVRVIARLLKQIPAEIDVLTAFAVIAPDAELNLSPPSAYVTDRSEAATRQRDEALRQRFYRNWGGRAAPGKVWCEGIVGMPCIRVRDPELGELVIETSASGLLLDQEETNSFSSLGFNYGHALASLPQWSDYEESAEAEGTEYPVRDRGYLTYLFVDGKSMREHNITYRTCENWSDPTKTHRVIREIYDYCSSAKEFRVSWEARDSA